MADHATVHITPLQAAILRAIGDHQPFYTFRQLCHFFKKKPGRCGTFYSSVKKLRDARAVVVEGCYPGNLVLTAFGKDLLRQIDAAPPPEPRGKSRGKVKGEKLSKRVAPPRPRKGWDFPSSYVKDSEKTQVGERVGILEGKTSLGGPSEREKVVDIGRLKTRAHGITFKLAVLVASGLDLVKFGFILRDRMTYESWKRQESTYTMLLNPTTGNIILHISPIFAPTADHALNVAVSIAIAAIVNLQEQTGNKIKMAGKMELIDIEVLAQSHAVVGDPGAIHMIENNVHYQDDRITIDASRGPEIEFTHPQLANQDHTRWTSAMSELTGGNWENYVSWAHMLIKDGGVDPRVIKEMVAERPDIISELRVVRSIQEEISASLGKIVAVEAEMVQNYGAFITGNQSMLSHFTELYHRVEEVAARTQAPPPPPAEPAPPPPQPHEAPPSSPIVTVSLPPPPSAQIPPPIAELFGDLILWRAERGVGPGPPAPPPFGPFRFESGVVYKPIT